MKRRTNNNPQEKYRDIFISVKYYQNELVDTICSDQTGKFLVQSIEGNQYLMVICDIDSGKIMEEPMRNLTEVEMVKSYHVLEDRFNNYGVTPKRNILDNETSEYFKDIIIKNKITFQLVPPHDHRRIIAKNTIQTFKNELVSILCSVDEIFPMHLWDRLL